MIQRQVSREVVEGGSVHVWLDLTSKIQIPLTVCSSFIRNAVILIKLKLFIAEIRI